MILYTDDLAVLVKFSAMAERTRNEMFVDLWREAGGKVSQEEEIDLVQTLDDKQTEIEAAREMIELQQAALIEKNHRLEKLEASQENLLQALYEKDSIIHNLGIDLRKLRNDSDFKESLAKTTIAQYLELIQRQQNTIDMVVTENTKLVNRTERLENSISRLRDEITEAESKIRHYEKITGDE